jgi:hypothetical protein
MAAYVQETGHATGTTSTLSVPVTNAPGAGNLLVARIGFRGSSGGSVSSVTDSKGNTWHIDVSHNVSSGHSALASTVQDVGTLTTSDTISVAFSLTPSNGSSAIVDEFSGMTNTVDTTATASGSTTNRTGGSLTTTNANDLLVAAYAGNGSESAFSVGTGWSAFTTQSLSSGTTEMVEGEYQLVSSTGTYTTAATGSSLTTQGVSAAYKQATGGGGNTFNDSGNGTITLSGSTLASLTFDDSGSGTITLGASASEAWLNSVAASGTITLGASTSEDFSIADAASGTILFGGSGSDDYVPPSGNYNDSGSGTITLSGSRVEAASFIALASGTLQLGGSGSESYGYYDAPIGTITLGASVVEGHSDSWSPTATFFFTGSDFDSWIGGQIALAIGLLLGDHGPLDVLRWRIIHASLDNDYPSGGYEITPAEMSFNTIRVLIPIANAGYIYQWNGSTLQAFHQSGSAGPLVEVPQGTDLSAQAVDLFIMGDHI